MQQLNAITNQVPRPISFGTTRTEYQQGSLTEVVFSNDSAIQPIHLLPVLARCSSNQRWLMWLSPHQRVNKRWLESVGLQKTPVVHVDLCTKTQLALCTRILDSGNSHMIIEWQGDMHESQRQDIKQHALKSGSHVVLIHKH